MRPPHMKMRQDHKVCKIAWESSWEQSRETSDDGVDWEALMEEVSTRLGPCFSKFVHGPAALAPLASLLEVQTLRAMEPKSAFQPETQLTQSTEVEKPSCWTHLTAQSFQACCYLLPHTSAIRKGEPWGQEGCLPQNSHCKKLWLLFSKSYMLGIW